MAGPHARLTGPLASPSRYDPGEADINVQMDGSGTVSEMSTFTYAASDDTLTLRRVNAGGEPAIVFALVRG